MLSKFRGVRGEKGFTLVELLIVIAIIGILAAIAIPQFSAYKNRAYQSDSKAALHNLFQACKAYWADNSGMNCTTALVSTDVFGFQKSMDVTVAITMGTEAGFAATAKHGLDTNSVTYKIDSDGSITNSGDSGAGAMGGDSGTGVMGGDSGAGAMGGDSDTSATGG